MGKSQPSPLRERRSCSITSPLQSAWQRQILLLSVAAQTIIVSGRRTLLRHQGEIPLDELRRTLSENSGIGFKIADCIALFGLGRFDAFPIDTHVKQYLGAWFNSPTALRPLSPASYLMMDAEARTFLKPEFAGYAGHILFHCWRKEIKKLRSF